MTAEPTSADSGEEIARLVADVMWKSDEASRALGMELLEARPGAATIAMTVSKAMTNGHGIAHGGLIFALADSAFAFACNSYGEAAVAAHCSIAFVHPGRFGDRLIAVAREISRFGRTAIYDVEVSANGVTIAQFRGHSRTVGGSFVDTANRRTDPA
jgi:acyl-CoA thioesterase